MADTINTTEETSQEVVFHIKYVTQEFHQEYTIEVKIHHTVKLQQHGLF